MSFQLNPNPYHWSNCYGDWGYFPSSLFAEDSVYKDSKIVHGSYYEFKKQTAWNVMSYIPGLNFLIGIIRLVSAYQMDYVNRDVGNMQKLRGVCDIFLGPLNMIPDLIVTLARLHIARPSPASMEETA